MRVLPLIQQTSNQNRTKRQKMRLFLVPALRAKSWRFPLGLKNGGWCLSLSQLYRRTHSIDLPVLSRLLNSNWSCIVRFPGRTAHSPCSLEMLVLSNHMGQTFLPHIHAYLHNHIFRHAYIISIFDSLRESEKKKCYLKGSRLWIKLNLLRREGSCREITCSPKRLPRSRWEDQSHGQRSVNAEFRGKDRCSTPSTEHRRTDWESVSTKT